MGIFSALKVRRGKTKSKPVTEPDSKLGDKRKNELDLRFANLSNNNENGVVSGPVLRKLKEIQPLHHRILTACIAPNPEQTVTRDTFISILGSLDYEGDKGSPELFDVLFDFFAGKRNAETVSLDSLQEAISTTRKLSDSALRETSEAIMQHICSFVHSESETPTDVRKFSRSEFQLFMKPVKLPNQKKVPKEG